jgi:hypothetical protein
LGCDDRSNFTDFLKNSERAADQEVKQADFAASLRIAGWSHIGMIADKSNHESCGLCFVCD